MEYCCQPNKGFRLALTNAHLPSQSPSLSSQNANPTNNSSSWFPRQLQTQRETCHRLIKQLVTGQVTQSCPPHLCKSSVMMCSAKNPWREHTHRHLKQKKKKALLKSRSRRKERATAFTQLSREQRKLVWAPAVTPPTLQALPKPLIFKTSKSSDSF